MGATLIFLFDSNYLSRDLQKHICAFLPDLCEFIRKAPKLDRGEKLKPGLTVSFEIRPTSWK